MRQALWSIVSGRSKRPVAADSKGATPEVATAIDAWDTRAEKAAGELYLLVSEEQKVHFAGISDDPCKMWTKLEKIHPQNANAYDALFSIQKLSDKALQAHLARVDQGMQNIKELRLDDFTCWNWEVDSTRRLTDTDTLQSELSD